MTSTNKQEELHYSLLKLKDSAGEYVINSLIASTPDKLATLEDFIKQQVLEAIAEIKSKSEAGYTVKQLEKYSPLGVVSKSVVPLSAIEQIEKRYRNGA